MNSFYQIHRIVKPVMGLPVMEAWPLLILYLPFIICGQVKVQLIV